MRTLIQLPSDTPIRGRGRPDQVANAVLALALIAVAAVEFRLTAHRPGSLSVGLPVAVAVGGLALCRDRNRTAALAGALTICTAAAAGSLTTKLPSQPGVTATAALLILGASYLRTATPRRAGMAAVAGVVVLTVGRADLRGPLILATALLGALAWSAALAVGIWLRSLDTHRRIMLEAVRRDERLELARELHDEVAHHVAAIVVQSQAARLLATRRPEHLAGALAEIETAGGDALTAMRQVIGLLRDADRPSGPGRPREETAPTERLSDLVQRFSDLGRPVDLRLCADPDGWTPIVTSTLYRLTQEALTNIARHAPEARAISVVVQQDLHGLQIEISDDGPGWTARSLASATAGSGGYGLVGMRERVEALGGRFEAGPRPGGDGSGWTVLASIPGIDAGP